MNAALGPPEKMAENEADLTPMMSQYFELCRQYDDSLVLFQVGDFYETFCEAAERTARLLEIALTQREDSTGTYSMAGIPIDNAESYIETLLDAGYRVAVADQVQDPEETTSVVDRAVTRIVTPGTLTEDELLDTDDNNFVACLTEDPDRYGLALLDVSTGDFYATSAGRRETIADEVSRFAPAEAIVEPAAEDNADLFDTAELCSASGQTLSGNADCMVSPYDSDAFDSAAARERVAAYFGSSDALFAPDAESRGASSGGSRAHDAEVRACGALLAYAEYTRGGEDGRLDYLNHLTRYEPREYVLLDRVALSSLELFERRAVRGDDDVTLLGVLDETSCALGSRQLKDWLRRPLLEPDRIEARLDAVEAWTHDVQAREEARDLLRDVYDIERLVARISRGRANARDLRSLKATLDVVPDLNAAMADFEAELLVELREELDELADVRELIDRAIRENPSREITEGDVIRRGYDEELDELRETEREGKAWIDDLEAQERERTGIDSLKVGHNSVHGYYIEVTNPNLDAVPDDYERRQTLKNSERFYTPELKEREDEILRAESRADDLEHELFREVRSTVADESERVQTVADALARLDVLAALAEVAATRDYARPEIGGDGIHVEGGRHPVVERTQQSFVPNDAHLERAAPPPNGERDNANAAESFAVITGPNMSGKSTYMRQVALVTVLAQTGSFVPAASARIAPVDRIFTRVGASDDIAGGRSTFMVEMTELAAILESATEDSLVLLDEVGRGTSTTDGLAIARAVTEHVHDEVGALTLFATHHHELTETAEELPNAFNLHFSADQDGEEVDFDHEVRRGAATASYGVQVAREAGVPDEVVGRARELLAEAEAADVESADEERDDGSKAEGAADSPPKAVADGAADELAARLREVDVATMTPLEAMNELAELKREAE
jgi:DNA mismatch repair protein MutS